MRSFICSALLIAGVLIGQQWITKSSEAQSAFPVAAAASAANAGLSAWLTGAR